MTEAMRLQKFLSKAGVASRRKAEALMLEGRVSVNGRACTELGTTVVPETDRVEVDGALVELPASHVYLLLNKPRGYITSLDDPHDRPIITDLLPERMPRVWPVGRLDWDSEGLLILTDDGDLTQALTHPSHHVPKGYAVKIRGRLADDSRVLDELKKGVEIDGHDSGGANIAVRGHTDKHTWLEFVLEEGRNRQIRKMCEAVGWTVLRLRRVAIGPLTIEGISPGDYRSLSSKEVLSLYDAAGVRPGERAKPSKRQKKRETAPQEALNRYCTHCGRACSACSATSRFTNSS